MLLVRILLSEMALTILQYYLWRGFFDDYEKRWFTDLEKAKKHLLNRFKHDAPYDTFKIVKVEDKYYEVQYAS